MSVRETLSVEEIKAILTAHSCFQTSNQVRLNVRINEIFGGTQPEKSRAVDDLELQIHDTMHGLIARRLKINRRTIPLIAPRDFKRVGALVVDALTNSDPSSTPEEREFAEKLVSQVLSNAIQQLSVFGRGRDPYEEYWRWIDVVVALAAEEKITPTQLFIMGVASEKVHDELIRRLYSREEFCSRASDSAKVFTDPEILKKIFLQPLLEIISKECDEEELQEVKLELENKFPPPDLRVKLDQAKRVIEAYISEEVTRIWG